MFCLSTHQRNEDKINNNLPFLDIQIAKINQNNGKDAGKLVFTYNISRNVIEIISEGQCGDTFKDINCATLDLTIPLQKFNLSPQR